MRHEEKAVEATWLLKLIAYTCLQLFIVRRLYKLKSKWRKEKLSIQEIRRVIRELAIQASLLRPSANAREYG